MHPGNQQHSTLVLSVGQRSRHLLHARRQLDAIDASFARKDAFEDAELRSKEAHLDRRRATGRLAVAKQVCEHRLRNEAAPARISARLWLVDALEMPAGEFLRELAPGRRKRELQP